MPHDSQPPPHKEGFFKKIFGHHSHEQHSHDGESDHEHDHEHEQSQQPHRRKSRVDKFKDYMEEDKREQKEVGAYGGLM
ncbi:hypothetical protein FE257_005007 [Aspergillus nanangensis]|uniref:Uncharacterized protein n=1 Tax=Aspergillus nanangensis TaxID=2582783 RepID=A0AAD4GVQ4_ASPNN|nr:hypothetical protein FE257_005007 [Aspergillus nanangensis]